MAEKVLMKGNEALAEAAIQAGCRHYFGYPITPQTEVAAYMAKRMPKIGGTFLQAESEIAAINMVYGVASTGCRVMTSSSSPGISLKSEGLSYLAGAELPAVVVDVNRAGPGLGNVYPEQSDYTPAVKGGGHGNYRTFTVAPASASAPCFAAVRTNTAESNDSPGRHRSRSANTNARGWAKVPSESFDLYDASLSSFR